MGRVISGTLAGIIAPGSKRDIDYTIDLSALDDFYFATSPLTAVNGHDYTNMLEKVGEIRQTLEAPTDRVAVAIQNKDGEIGKHVANYWQFWRTATAKIGRVYYEIGATGKRTGTSQWIQMFSGSVQQPNVNDLQVTFDLIPDTTSPGQIVCSRGCGTNCPWVYKDPRTCGSSSVLPTCDHNLKSSGGCDGRANFEHYGGTEHRYQPDVAAPGTGGNDDPPEDDPPCPATDNYVRVRGENGRPVAKLAASLTLDDWLWHSIRRCFYAIAALEIVHDQPIWETVGPRGIRGSSSQRHPVIRDAEDTTGTAVEEFAKGEHFLIEDAAMGLEAVRCRDARDTGRLGSVVRISIDAPTNAEKIYCWSAKADGPFIVCHNEKQDPV